MVVQSVADVAAAVLTLWILLSSLEVDHTNPFVDFVRATASWLGWWAQAVFTTDNAGVRLLLTYGLPAVLYVAGGHATAAWMRRPRTEPPTGPVR